MGLFFFCDGDGFLDQGDGAIAALVDGGFNGFSDHEVGAEGAGDAYFAIGPVFLVGLTGGVLYYVAGVFKQGKEPVEVPFKGGSDAHLPQAGLHFKELINNRCRIHHRGLIGP